MSGDEFEVLGKHSTVFRDKLKTVITEADVLRGSVCYWTISHHELGAEFVETISKESSFLCVDPHPPTDLDRLGELAELGGNIYVYLKRVNPKAPIELRREGNSLLHPKTFLFDFDGRKPECFMGSHNMTSRALNGLNMEGSSWGVLDRSGDYYQQLAAFLEECKGECIPLQSEDVPAIKRLFGKWDDDQDGWERGKRFDLEVERREDLDNLESTAVVFFVEDESLSLAKSRIRMDVIVTVTWQGDGMPIERIYDGEIVQMGSLGKGNPLGRHTRFTEYRWAPFRNGEAVAPLSEDGGAPATRSKSSVGFVLVALNELMGEDSLVANPPLNKKERTNELWRPQCDSEYIEVPVDDFRYRGQTEVPALTLGDKKAARKKYLPIDCVFRRIPRSRPDPDYD
jgi:hypothetical protein